jgi:hypothetical protein
MLGFNHPFHYARRSLDGWAAVLITRSIISRSNWVSPDTIRRETFSVTDFYKWFTWRPAPRSDECRMSTAVVGYLAGSCASVTILLCCANRVTAERLGLAANNAPV